MDIKELMAQLTQQRRTLGAGRAALETERGAILAKVEDEKRTDLTDEESTEFRGIGAKLIETDDEDGKLAARIAELDDMDKRDAAAAETRKNLGQNDDTEKRPTGGAKTDEERTYTARKATNVRETVSFFTDAYAMTYHADSQARSRLERHATEAKVHGELEERADTISSFAGLVVPQYLVDEYAMVLRNGRPTVAVCRKLPLPAQGTSFIIPRGTTGAAVASQATENTAVQSTDEVWANVTVPVVTISGQQDVSRQSLERGTPGLDQIIYSDIVGAYAQELDRQVLNGSGASGQMLGILNTGSINAATAYGAAPTAALFSLKIAGQVTAISSAGTILTPRVVIMHPRRWGWLQSLTDTTGRPLAVATAVNPFNALAVVTAAGEQSAGPDPTTASAQFVGMLASGLPVVTDANMPINVGTNVEDMVVVMDNAQALLWLEGDGMPKQLRFEQTLGANLTVKLVCYSYAAFTAGRYPVAFGKVGGLDGTATWGQVAPAF
jgi:HK97 family phage major capsid protein